jgi:hypothetical protein
MYVRLFPLFRLALGPDAQHISIRIFELHLKSPGIFRRSHADGHPASSQILVDDLDIVDAQPNPRASAALGASAEVDTGTIPIDRREVIRTPARID